MVLIFTVAHINICFKWLLIVSHLLCTKTKKNVVVNSRKTAVNIGF